MRALMPPLVSQRWFSKQERVPTLSTGFDFRTVQPTTAGQDPLRRLAKDLKDGRRQRAVISVFILLNMIYKCYDSVVGYRSFHFCS